MRGRKTGAAAAAAIGLASGLAGWQAMAQQVPPKLVFNLGSKLTTTSNYGLKTPARPATTLDTTLGFVFNSQTRLDSLRFSVSGLVRASSDSARTDKGFKYPAASLDYQRATQDARFSLSGRIRSRDTAETSVFIELPDGTLSPEPLVGTGTVTNSSARIGYEAGRRAPFGFALSASARNRHYTGVVDPSAYDSRHRSASATLNFRPSEITSYSLGANWSRETNFNLLQTRRRNTGIFLGAERTLSPALSLQGRIGYQRSETDQIVLAAPTVSSGLYGSLGVTRKVATGSQSLSLGVARDSIGTRNTLNVGAATKTRSGATLSGRIGLTQRPGHNAQVVGQVRYAGKLPDARYSLSFDRKVSLNADNVDVAYTRLGASYSYQVSPIADLGASVNWSRTSAAGFGTYSGTERKTLQVTYSHDLTRDWRWSAGVQYRHQDNATGTAHASSAFLTLKRSFTLLP